MTKTWIPLAALHIVSILLAFQDGLEKQKDDAKQPQRATEQSSPAEPTKSQASPKTTFADEPAIRKIVEQFEAAFNEHDAKKIAALFAKEAEVVNCDCQTYRGREEIEESFAEFFEENPEVTLSIEIDSIRPLGSSLAIEEGISSVMHQEDNPREIARYTVIYAKEDDQWVMCYARDTTADEAADEHVKNLSWLIGEWMDESSDAVVISTYRWTENRRAIEGEFHLHTDGYPSMDGTHRVGWDPQAKQLRSWVFDSEGGFASGLWSETEDGWMIKMTGVVRDGRSTSATNTLRRESGDHLVFRSVDRVIGGDALPDGDEITIVRHAPPPEEAVSAKE